jgi:hypothetical protein
VDTYVICVDVEKDLDRIAYNEVFPKTGATLLPNKPIVVRVRHPADRRVTVTASGKEGFYTPSIRMDLPDSAQLSRGAKARGNVPLVVTEKVLPPRLPGAAKVRVQVEAPARAGPVDAIEHDFEVLETFIGALRIGIAAVGAGAVNAEYEARLAPGSQQAQVAAKVLRPFEYELLLGYAPFFEKGGRPVNGCTAAPWCFAPYLGLGVVSPRADGGVDFLTSVHLGAEWEPVPSFSIAATLVGRRVERLASGLRVGGPVAAEATLVETQYTVGAALVFNVSPQFLALSVRGAAELLK